MGLKFYRGTDKSKKIRKRFTQTRTWFRQFKWLAYHAHPEFVARHGFKGGNVYSTGFLLNPEMKRFQINTPGAFFSAYFGGSTYQMSSPKCGKMLENLKNCYETNQPAGRPEEACAYYIDGFKRLACNN